MLIDAATLHDLDVLTASTPRGQVAIDLVGTERVEQAAIPAQIAGERLVGALTLDDAGGGVARGSQAAAQVLTAGARPCAIDEAPQRPAARG